MEVAVTGSEAEGWYGPLRRAVLHSSLPTSSPPPKKTCHAPSSFISHLPLQESRESEASVPTEQALESTSSTAPLVLERERFLLTCNPFVFSWGASREYTDVRLRVAGRVHQPLVLPFVLTCVRYTWEWGWCAPSATILFSTLTHSDITRRVT